MYHKGIVGLCMSDGSAAASPMVAIKNIFVGQFVGIKKVEEKEIERE